MYPEIEDLAYPCFNIDPVPIRVFSNNTRPHVMPLQPWKKLATEILFENPWWKYQRDAVLLPNGSKGEYHYVETPGSVMVLARTEENELLMVRQYRHLNERESLEFPAGGMKPGQNWDVAARAELREEAGIEADTLRLIGSFNPFNGVTSEICRVYLATGLRAVQAEPDPTEQFEVLAISESDLQALIASGELWDGMTLAAWSLYRTTLFGSAFSRGRD